jgi:hypothetical protein
VLDPRDPGALPTEAELLATLDRIQAAADVLVEGIKRAGQPPVLDRTQGW